MDLSQLSNIPTIYAFDQGLISGLSHFGLNPIDWKIIPKSNNTFQIQNRKAPTFCFKGISNKVNGQKRWTEIILMSL